jgi:hypothetical protein
MGETGEYEDRGTWPVKGYLNRRLAEHHAKRAEERGRQLICAALNIPLTDDPEILRKVDKDFDRWEDIVEKDGANEWDERFHVSYTNETRYYVLSYPIYIDLTPENE